MKQKQQQDHYIGVREEQIYTEKGLNDRLKHNIDQTARMSYDHVDNEKIQDNVYDDDNSAEYSQWLASLNIDPNVTYISKLQYWGKNADQKKLIPIIKEKYKEYKKDNRAETWYERKERLKKEQGYLTKQIKKALNNETVDDHLDRYDLTNSKDNLTKRVKREPLQFKTKMAKGRYNSSFKKNKKKNKLMSAYNGDQKKLNSLYKNDKYGLRMVECASKNDLTGFLEASAKRAEFRKNQTNLKGREAAKFKKADKNLEEMMALINKAAEIELEYSETLTKENYNYQRQRDQQVAFVATLSEDERKVCNIFNESKSPKRGLEQVLYFTPDFEKEEFDREAKLEFNKKWGQFLKTLNPGDEIISSAWHMDEPDGTPHCHYIIGLRDGDNLRKHNQNKKGYLKSLQDESKRIFDEVCKNRNISLNYEYKRGISKYDDKGEVKEEYKQRQHKRAQDWKREQSIKQHQAQENFAIQGELLNLEHMNEYASKDEVFQKKFRIEIGRLRRELKRGTFDDNVDVGKLRSLMTTLSRAIFLEDENEKLEKIVKAFNKIDMDAIANNEKLVELLEEKGIWEVLCLIGDSSVPGSGGQDLDEELVAFEAEQNKQAEKKSKSKNKKTKTRTKTRGPSH